MKLRDLINGKEPSINELVTRSPAVWNDMSGNNNNMVAYGSPSLAKFGIAHKETVKSPVN